jgi:hypothetical protein
MLLNKLKFMEILLNKLKSLLEGQYKRLASVIRIPTLQGSVIIVVYSKLIMWTIKSMGMSNVQRSVV